jgi:hypothetical protein
MSLRETASEIFIFPPDFNHTEGAVSAGERRCW